MRLPRNLRFLAMTININAHLFEAYFWWQRKMKYRRRLYLRWLNAQSALPPQPPKIIYFLKENCKTGVTPAPATEDNLFLPYII